MNSRILPLLIALSFAGTASAKDYWPPKKGAWRATKAGIDAKALKGALRFAKERSSRGVIVLRGGRIAAERYWEGWTRKTVRDMFSAQKAVTSVLVGIAHERKLIENLDGSVVRYFPEWKGEPQAKITVRHLLSMTSGLHSSKRSDLFRHMVARDKTAYALRLPLDHPPGKRWAYGNAAYGLLIALVERATGKARQAFAKEVLFDPIGMSSSHCGITPIPTKSPRLKLTHHGLETTCRDMARFGLLVLRRGRWAEKQIVPAAYLKAATTWSGSQNKAYGYLWWLNRGRSCELPYAGKVIPSRLFPSCPPDAVAALGAKDSKIYVVPSLDLVVCRLGESATPKGGVAPTSFDDGFLSRVCKAVTKR
jgi:CubicO group peptidase (beta-lactamase class C family)